MVKLTVLFFRFVVFSISSEMAVSSFCFLPPVNKFLHPTKSSVKINKTTNTISARIIVLAFLSSGSFSLNSSYFFFNSSFFKAAFALSSHSFALLSHFFAFANHIFAFSLKSFLSICFIFVPFSAVPDIHHVC